MDSGTDVLAADGMLTEILSLTGRQREILLDWSNEQERSPHRPLSIFESALELEKSVRSG